jgi:hypothetical protein
MLTAQLGFDQDGQSDLRHIEKMPVSSVRMISSSLFFAISWGFQRRHFVYFWYRARSRIQAVCCQHRHLSTVVACFFAFVSLPARRILPTDMGGVRE